MAEQRPSKKLVAVDGELKPSDIDAPRLVLIRKLNSRGDPVGDFAYVAYWATDGNPAEQDRHAELIADAVNGWQLLHDEVTRLNREIEIAKSDLVVMTEIKDAVNDTLRQVVTERNELREKLRATVEPADGLWNPYSNDGMRHMESSDVTGGETDAEILGDLDYLINSYPQIGRGLERAKKEIERLRRASSPPSSVDIAIARNCLGNLYAAVQRFGPIDADIQFAMREAAQFLGPPYTSETKSEPYVMKPSEEASFIKARRKRAVPDETLDRSKPALPGETTERTWLIRKGGYFYRPDRAGYTSSIADAGRYTEAEAKAEVTIEPAIMQAIPTKECSYCFGEGRVSLSNGDRMLCSLCGGGGVIVSETTTHE